MVKTLYIVGNGFDLRHGIPSSYKAFGEYLRTVDAKTY
ncbi:AbiH family protein [Mesorhizobium australicum]